MARSKYKKQETEFSDAALALDADSTSAGVTPHLEPSRSAKKRDSDAMKALGMNLAELSPRQLQDLELSDALFKAITDYQRITSNSAKRRQRGFIGGLLRDDAAEAKAIEARYTALTQHDADAKRVHHQLENWRERLIADDSALTEFLDEYGTNAKGADRSAGENVHGQEQSEQKVSAQELRTMIRRARTAKDEAQRKKATKALYRKLANIAQA